MAGFITIPEVRIVAGCDVYDIKRDRFQNRVTKYYADKGIKNKLDMYIHYEELLARKDIDAVVIASPDHQHALMAIAACRAGKDIYIENRLHSPSTKDNNWLKLSVKMPESCKWVVCNVP